MRRPALAGRRVAVIGGGWAGLAAAVASVQAGQDVTVFEMAPAPGGRARTVSTPQGALDNGQHILLGAYAHTLEAMRTVGVDPAAAFLRTPLRLVDPAGRGLVLPPGAVLPAFVRGVWAAAHWSHRERLALLRAAGGWGWRRFAAPASHTVDELTAGLPARIRHELIEPLCVAALNTPSAQASAAVFLRVLRDALFQGPGSADLLLPRRGLGELFPQPAARWLAGAGATLRLGRRVQALERDAPGWRVDGEAFDSVVLATTATEAARLTRTAAPAWSARAAALRHEPIVTVYLRSAGTRLAGPMTLLCAGEAAPAQFVFDHGHLGGPAGLLAFVISDAAAWVARGAEVTVAATRAQARATLGTALKSPLEVVQVLTQRRATFACLPGLDRPGPGVAPGLRAAGDYIEGPYPATLEGAVRSGRAAISPCKTEAV